MSQITPSLQPINVSYQTLERANSYSVVLFNHWLPLYGLADVTFFQTCGAIINYLFAAVYETDNELAVARSEGHYLATEPIAFKRLNLFLDLLKELNLTDPLIDGLLPGTRRYWELADQMMGQRNITPESLYEGLSVAPSDVVVAHIVSHKLLDMPFDIKRMEAIQAGLALWVLEADLITYHLSIAENFYNFYRMFVWHYGDEAITYLQTERQQRLNRFLSCLEPLTDHEQQVFKEIVQSMPKLYENYFGTMGLEYKLEPLIINGFSLEVVVIPEPRHE